jgi:hypothetical protein
LKNFLLIFSFINAILYILVYSYYDYILGLFGEISVSAGFLSFLKILILIIVGFLIGLMAALLLNLKIDRSYFDYKALIIIGTIPFICLILSEGTITNFFITNFFDSSRRISELVFYLFSRQIIWTLWLGFSIGSSVRLSFKLKVIKHEVRYRVKSL